MEEKELLPSSSTITYIEPIKKKRNIVLFWELPKEIAEDETSKPADLLCYVLGHESEGSLLAQLKHEQLASELACGAFRRDKEHALLYIQIELTKEGQKQVYRVIERTFQAIAFLRENQFPSSLFQEIQMLEKIGYQYPSRKNPFEQVVELVGKMPYESLETFPEKSYVTQEVDQSQLSKLIDTLSVENAHIEFLTDGNWTKDPQAKTEKWLGVKYINSQVPNEVFVSWKDALAHPHISFPEANPFVPKSLQIADVIKGEQEILIENSDRAKVFWVSEENVLSPESYVSLRIRSPSVVTGDPRYGVYLDFLIKTWKDAIRSSAYQAMLTGLQFDLTTKEDGVLVEVYGLSDSAAKFIETLLGTLKSLSLSEELYSEYKDSLAREYQNFNRSGPLEQGIERVREVLYLNYPSLPEKEKALKKVKLKQVQEFLEGFLEQNFIESLFYGNLTVDQAKSSWQKWMQNWNAKPYPPSLHEHRKIAQFSKKGPYYWEGNIKNDGNAAILVIRYSENSLQYQTVYEIAELLMKQPFFDELRTKQQTAYALGHLHQEVEGNHFSLFAIESHSHDPRDLLARIELFIEESLGELMDDSSKQRFEKIKDSRIAQLRKGLETTKERGQEKAKLAFDYDGDFTRNERLIEAYEKLDYETFVKEATASVGRENHRRVALLLQGEIPKEVQFRYRKAKSLGWIKRQSEYQTKKHQLADEVLN